MSPPSANLRAGIKKRANTEWGNGSKRRRADATAAAAFKKEQDLCRKLPNTCPSQTVLTP